MVRIHTCSSYGCPSKNIAVLFCAYWTGQESSLFRCRSYSWMSSASSVPGVARQRRGNPANQPPIDPFANPSAPAHPKDDDEHLGPLPYSYWVGDWLADTAQEMIRKAWCGLRGLPPVQAIWRSSMFQSVYCIMAVTIDVLFQASEGGSVPWVLSLKVGGVDVATIATSSGDMGERGEIWAMKGVEPSDAAPPCMAYKIPRRMRILPLLYRTC